ncbi:MAG: hypothetical protein JWO19_1503 [Bryobacterales bacterium]|jgi:hypothetical protein|nr:hypothetical protein [Bryobacterales bacterium]
MDGFKPIATKEDCKDSLRKEARAQERFRTSWEPGTIYATLLQRLSDEQVHDIGGLFGENGGAESDRAGKLYHIAHRGKCTGQWTLYRNGGGSVRLVFHSSPPK